MSKNQEAKQQHTSHVANLAFLHESKSFHFCFKPDFLRVMGYNCGHMWKINMAKF